MDFALVHDRPLFCWHSTGGILLLLDQLMGCCDGLLTDLVLQSTLHGFEDAFRDYGWDCPQERVTGPRAGIVNTAAVLDRSGTRNSLGNIGGGHGAV
jgi:hypothetical protein